MQSIGLIIVLSLELKVVWIYILLTYANQPCTQVEPPEAADKEEHGLPPTPRKWGWCQDAVLINGESRRWFTVLCIRQCGGHKKEHVGSTTSAFELPVILGIDKMSPQHVSAP